MRHRGCSSGLWSCRAPGHGVAESAWSRTPCVGRTRWHKQSAGRSRADHACRSRMPPVQSQDALETTTERRRGQPCSCPVLASSQLLARDPNDTHKVTVDGWGRWTKWNTIGKAVAPEAVQPGRNEPGCHRMEWGHSGRALQHPCGLGVTSEEQEAITENGSR